MQFSIITCTYNVEKNLAKTLDSVLLQNFSDYEIIVIDGKSTDKTLEIAKEYEKKFDGKLKWFGEKDLGIYDAMNKGIKIAKGNWLYFLNSGDIFCDSEILKKVNFEIEKDKLNSIFYGKIELENTGFTYGEEWTAEKLLKGNISHQAIFFVKIYLIFLVFMI
jgi:glycosyltransferase involved in cell wall biosynthesis